VPAPKRTVEETDMTQEVAANRDGVLSFGSFELVPNRRLLSRDGKPVRIGKRALDLLFVLVENAGNVIANNDLILQVWGNAIVGDSNVRVHISALRRVLGDDGFENRFIVHVARRGYVFVAPLERRVADHIASPSLDRGSYGALGTPSAHWAVHC
jgi:DNA-binding winged helix-turn-helix (wHTH) protein